MSDSELTRSLSGSRTGDAEAKTQVWTRLYDELRAISHRELAREQSGHTLSTTALVHEAYFKLVGETRLARQDRLHFLALACRAMRQVLIEYARKRTAKKRDGGGRAVTLEEALAIGETSPQDLLALNEALTRLSGFNERLGEVVELRFFGGLTLDETAEVMEVSTRTVERDWGRAKAYLSRMLSA